MMCYYLNVHFQGQRVKLVPYRLTIPEAVCTIVLSTNTPATVDETELS